MTDLLPVEKIVLTVARSQVARGEGTSPNVSAGLILIIERLLEEHPDTVQHLLIGDLPRGVLPDNLDEYAHEADGRLLVTVYGNGNGEVAYRPSDDTRVRWGVPSPLTPAP